MADNEKVEQVTADMDELSFDPAMTKKKASSGRKKSVAFEDPSTAQVAPASAEQGMSPFFYVFFQPLTFISDAPDELMFPAKKKAPKKILKDTGDAGNDATDEKPGDEEELDFSSLKKKKKKRVIEDQVAALDAQLEEAGIVDEKEAEVEGEDPFKAEGEGAVAEEMEEEAWLKSDRDYTYEEVSPLHTHP